MGRELTSADHVGHHRGRGGGRQYAPAEVEPVDRGGDALDDRQAALAAVRLDAVDAERVVRWRRLGQPGEQGEQHLAGHDRGPAHVERLGAGQAELGQEPDLVEEDRVQRELEADVPRAEALGERRLLGVDRVDRRRRAGGRAELHGARIGQRIHELDLAVADDRRRHRELIEDRLDRVRRHQRAGRRVGVAAGGADDDPLDVVPEELDGPRRHHIGLARRRAHPEHRQEAGLAEPLVEPELLPRHMEEAAQVDECAPAASATSIASRLTR